MKPNRQEICISIGFCIEIGNQSGVIPNNWYQSRAVCITPAAFLPIPGILLACQTAPSVCQSSSMQCMRYSSFCCVYSLLKFWITHSTACWDILRQALRMRWRLLRYSQAGVENEVKIHALIQLRGGKTLYNSASTLHLRVLPLWCNSYSLEIEFVLILLLSWGSTFLCGWYFKDCCSMGM